MNATPPLKILMPPGRRRDDSEKPHSTRNLLALWEKEKGINYTFAFDNQHAFRDDMAGEQSIIVSEALWNESGGVPV